MIGPAPGYLHWIRDRWRLWGLRSEPERGPVLIVLFHSLFRSRQEARSGLCDPQQGITVDFFAEFVESLLTHGVAVRRLEDAFLQPQQGLTAVITFDDGYFNNVHALRVLERLEVPATFFISTRHVQHQKSFWWDALYRQSAQWGIPASTIAKQVRSLKRLRTEEIEARVMQWCGARALTPVSDCDRPFNAAELADFARSRHVFLGNHTGDHAILVNYEPQAIRSQIDEAQSFLGSITGAPPRSIAYPNGSYDARVLEIARDAGLEFGVTIRSGWNVPATQQPMELLRLIVWAVPSAARQGKVLGSMVGSGNLRSPYARPTREGTPR